MDRCVERENLALEENTARAERDFFHRRRAWARRTGARLPKSPQKAFDRLTGSAFGCDWLIDRWEELAADLEMPGGYWSRAEFLRALLLLGIDSERIPPGQPVVATLYLASLAADRVPNPEEVEAFLGLDTKGLDPEARAVAQRKALGDRQDGRLLLRNFVRAEQDRLRQLRATLWETTDAPALALACAPARTFDACPAAALARRYEASQSLELHRNLKEFSRARQESEKHPQDDSPRIAPAPNERQDGETRDGSSQPKITSERPAARPQASPWSPERVATASPGRPQDDPGRKRDARRAAREARKRMRRMGR